MVTKFLDNQTMVIKKVEADFSIILWTQEK